VEGADFSCDTVADFRGLDKGLTIPYVIAGVQEFNRFHKEQRFGRWAVLSKHRSALSSLGMFLLLKSGIDFRIQLFSELQPALRWLKLPKKSEEISTSLNNGLIQGRHQQ